MKTMGLVGAGRWGRNLANSFSKKVRIEKVVSSGNPNNISKLQKVIPGIVPSSLKDMISDENIEAIIIASPIAHLADIAKMCFQHDKHIFLEKPAAQDVDEIKGLMYCRGKQVCFVNYLYLADRSYAFFKTAIKHARITRATFIWHKWGTFNNDILLNLVSHELAFLIDSFGMPIISERSHIEKDHCILSLKCNNIPISIEVNRAINMPKRMVTYETSEGVYTWAPGCFKHNDTLIASSSTHNLIDRQRDIFLSHIDDDTGYSNLRLAMDVLNVVQELRL